MIKLIKIKKYFYFIFIKENIKKKFMLIEWDKKTFIQQYYLLTKTLIKILLIKKSN